MRYQVLVALILLHLLVSCSSIPKNAATLVPEDLIREASESLIPVQTLRVTIERSGADYGFNTVIGPVVFNRLTGQFVAPNIIYATARVALAKLPVELELYADGEQQWIRGVFSNNEWQSGEFAPGFNPKALVTESGTGLQATLSALQTIDYIGETQLEDGTTVHHIRSTADGTSVSALLVNLVEMTGKVEIDLFIDKANKHPLKFVVVQPDSRTDIQPDPTTWIIELFDYDAPPDSIESPMT